MVLCTCEFGSMKLGLLGLILCPYSVQQVGDADKGGGTESDRATVKPVAVECTDAPPAVAAAMVEKCGDKIVADVVIVVAHKGASEVSPARSDSLSDDIDFEFHPQHKSVAVGSDVQGPEKHAAGTVPDAPVIASAGEEAAAAGCCRKRGGWRRLIRGRRRL